MFLYRGKDIGGRQNLITTCLDIIRRGDSKELYEIVPHVRLLRAPEFLDPLLELLSSGSVEQKTAVAMVLGSLGDWSAIRPLTEVCLAAATSKERGADSLQAAAISALGEFGCAEATEALVEIMGIQVPKDYFKAHRPGLVVSSLSQIAQQGVERAETELRRLIDEAPTEVRCQALAELCVAFWHRPNEMPEEFLAVIENIARDESKALRTTALASLSSLAQLGCVRAQELIGGQGH